MAQLKRTFKARRKNIQRRLGITAQFMRKRPGEGTGAAKRPGTETFKALRALRKKGKI